MYCSPGTTTDIVVARYSVLVRWPQSAHFASLMNMTLQRTMYSYEYSIHLLTYFVPSNVLLRLTYLRYLSSMGGGLIRVSAQAALSHQVSSRPFHFQSRSPTPSPVCPPILSRSAPALLLSPCAGPSPRDTTRLPFHLPQSPSRYKPPYLPTLFPPLDAAHAASPPHNLHPRTPFPSTPSYLMAASVTRFLG